MVKLDLYELQFAEESTAGTENTSYSSFPGRVLSAKATPQNDEIAMSDIATREEADELFHGKEHFPWEIEFAIQHWAWVYWAAGAISTNGTDPYTHTITLNNTIPSLSLEFVYASGDFSIKFLGSKVDTFDLTFVAGEIPKAKITGYALSGSVDVTPGTPSQLSTTPFEWHQTSTLTINAASYKAVCERAQYQFKNNIAEDYGLHQRAPSELNEGGGRGLVANYTIRANDETLFMLRENYTDFAVVHTITRDTNDTFEITIPSAKTHKPERSSSGGGTAFKMNLPVKAIGSGYDFEAVDSNLGTVYSNPG